MNFYSEQCSPLHSFPRRLTIPSLRVSLYSVRGRPQDGSVRFNIFNRAISSVIVLSFRTQTICIFTRSLPARAVLPSSSRVLNPTHPGPEHTKPTQTLPDSSSLPLGSSFQLPVLVGLEISTARARHTMSLNARSSLKSSPLLLWCWGWRQEV